MRLAELVAAATRAARRPAGRAVAGLGAGRRPGPVRPPVGHRRATTPRRSASTPPSDRLFFLRRSGVLDRMLALFEQRPEVRARRAGAVARRGRRGAGRGGRPVRRRAAGAGHAAAAGARHRRARRRIRCAPSSGRCASVGRPWATGVAERLDGAARGRAALCGADAPARRRLLAELRRDLAGVQERLGRRRRRCRRPCCTRTCGPRRTRPAATGASWTRLAADPLRSLRRILPVFDVALPQRLTFQGFFLARFGRGGRCDDLLRLVHDFHEDLFDQYLQVTAAAAGRRPGRPPAAGGELAGPARAHRAGRGPGRSWSTACGHCGADAPGARGDRAARGAGGRGRPTGCGRCRPASRRTATSSSSPPGTATRCWCSTTPTAGCASRSPASPTASATTSAGRLARTLRAAQPPTERSSPR